MAKAQQKTVTRAKKDEAVQRVEDTIRSRFIDDAEYFDKDNIMAQLITEHKGNFKRMDLELTAQHTVATGNLHKLVFQHSSDFLSLFRDIHRAHSLVDDLKKDVQDTKSIIAALSKLSFSLAPSDNDASNSSAVDGSASGVSRSTITKTRASMLADGHAADLVTLPSISVVHQLQYPSLRLIKDVVPLPSSGVSTRAVSADARSIRMFRDVVLEEVRQRIAEGNLTAAGDWIASLEAEATEKGLLPVLLKLEEELAQAAVAQIQRLPVTFAYFESLQLPLLRLLVQLGRAETASKWYFQLHSDWIEAELRSLRSAVEPKHYCFVATDMLVMLIQHTLNGWCRLGIVVGGGTGSSRRAAKGASPGRLSSRLSSSNESSGPPPPPPSSQIPASSQVVLWVRGEVARFGEKILVPRVLSLHGGADGGAGSFAAAAQIIADCIAYAKPLSVIGVPHSDTVLLRTLVSPLSVILKDLVKRVSQNVFSTAATLTNSIKLGLRNAAVSLSDQDRALRLNFASSVLSGARDANKALALRLLHLAPSSHLHLLVMLVSPVSSFVFQSTLSSQKITNDSIGDLLKRGVQLNDPYVWSSMKSVRNILVDACTTAGSSARAPGAGGSALAEAVQLLQSGARGLTRAHREAVALALQSFRINTIAIQKAQDRAVEERLQLLSANCGGTQSTVVTPAILTNLLTRNDIANPYWSRAVRDIFADAVAARCDQVQASLNSLFAVLRSHAATNPITLTHKKVVSNLLRNYRFAPADLPESMVERMDEDHVMWLLSTACETSYWNTSGPREYFADVLEAQKSSKYAEVIAFLRGDQPIDTSMRQVLQQELLPITASAIQQSSEVSNPSAPASVDAIKAFLTPAAVVAGRWPRRVRSILATALELRYVGRVDGFAKIADIARKLKDPLPLRISVDDRKLTAVTLAVKSDDFLSAALAVSGNSTTDLVEHEEFLAVSLVSADHLTFLINKSSSEIGIPFWSRGTRDALADALERQQQKTTTSVHENLIQMLRSTPSRVRLTADQRKDVREALKRKVEGECSASTREVAVQSWMRVSPTYVKNLVLASNTSDSAPTDAGANTAGSSSVGDVWCDIIRFAVATALKSVVQNWQKLVELLRAPMREPINKDRRVEVSKLLSAHTFTPSDLAKYTTTSGASKLSDARKGILSSKAMVPAEDFAFVVSSSCGPSQLYHVIANAMVSLLAACRGSSILPGESSASVGAVGGNLKHSQTLVLRPETFLTSNSVISEQIDSALAGLARSLFDAVVVQTQVVAKLSSCDVLQGASRRTSQGELTLRNIAQFAHRDGCCTWIFHTLFAMLTDVLATTTMLSYIHSPHGLSQLIGEDTHIRVLRMRSLCDDVASPLLRTMANYVFGAAWDCCAFNAPDASKQFFEELLRVQYVADVSQGRFSDITTPNRMAGLILPLDGYSPWQLARTIPCYPGFFDVEVDVADEAFLFHYAVQLSLNLMLLFQEVLLRDTTVSGVSTFRRSAPTAFLSEVLPGDSSSMQHWLVHKQFSTNYVTAVALLQTAVLRIVESLTEDSDGPASVWCEMYGAQALSKQLKPEVVRQIVNFFSTLYYFWAPLFTSAYCSSILAQGHLSTVPLESAPTTATQQTYNKKSSSEGAPLQAAAAVKLNATTSEVSGSCLDGQQSAKFQLCRTMLGSSVGEPVFDQVPQDPLAIAVCEFFSKHPALQGQIGTVFSDATRAKISKLMTKINLLEFAVKETLADDDEEADDDVTQFLCLAHVHELLVHYVRPLS